MRRPRQLHKPKEFKKLSGKDRKILPTWTAPSCHIFPAQSLKTLDLLRVNDILRKTFLWETLMTKAELVEKVAAQINLTKKQTEVVVNTVFQSITESLAQGKKVELRGFGSFRVRSRNARIGRNPKSGDRVDVPAKRVPFFKAGKELRELVDGDLDISADTK